MLKAPANQEPRKCSLDEPERQSALSSETRRTLGLTEKLYLREDRGREIEGQFRHQTWAPMGTLTYITHAHMHENAHTYKTQVPHAYK